MGREAGEEMEEALIIQALQITGRRLGAAPDMSNQGLWRVLMDSLKGCNGLMVEKGLWRKLASQSEGGFQSQNQGGGDVGGKQGGIWIYLKPFSICIQLCGKNERKMVIHSKTLACATRRPEFLFISWEDSRVRSFSVGFAGWAL